MMRAVLPTRDPSSPWPEVGDLADPLPGRGEVLVRVHAAGLNRADLWQLRGSYPPPPGESEVPGLECAGVIEALGPEVTFWQPGDRVMALLAGGGHAEKVVVPVGQLMAMPPNWSFAEAAAVPEVALTAWTNLVAEGGLEEGQSVVITGANGGVGTFTVQLARQFGARVIAAGRGLERLEPLRELGASELVVLAPDLPAAIRRANGGQGVDLALDLIGGEHLPRLLLALRSGGRLVLVGIDAGQSVEVPLGVILSRRLSIIGSVLRPRSRAEKAELVRCFMNFAQPRLEDGRLRPVVDRVLPFERIADAYRALMAGGVAGKIIVEMSAAYDEPENTEHENGGSAEADPPH
ncbi:MAG: NAD(P)H-quinone oxidoreductase [Acidobacteriota bacterium]